MNLKYLNTEVFYRVAARISAAVTLLRLSSLHTLIASLVAVAITKETLAYCSCTTLKETN